MLTHVLATLAAIRAAKRVRDDLVVAGQTPLSSAHLGDGTHSLATILRGETHREEWRFLRSLDQTSPWGGYQDSRRPGDFQEVVVQGKTGIGMLWAQQNDSAVLSFAFPPNWSECHVQADFREMDEMGTIRSAEVTIRNLSRREHVDIYREFIRSYGNTESTSSLVYEGDGFVVRMYLNDHNPPHFHVMRRNTSETFARCAIQTLDVLSGSLAPPLRPRVEGWARSRRAELMRNWDRCRSGRLPFSLQE